VYEKIKTLIELGANVNLPGKGMIYKLPLNQAIVLSSIQFKRLINEQYAKKVIQTLISRGAHVSKKDENDMTPLHVAAKFDNYFAANELLKAGAKVMDRNENGKTPLDLAESSEMIKLLKKYGAKE
jgi:ankyrin repeat protein